MKSFVKKKRENFRGVNENNSIKVESCKGDYLFPYAEHYWPSFNI